MQQPTAPRPDIANQIHKLGSHLMNQAAQSKQLPGMDALAKYEHLRITTLRPQPKAEVFITIDGKKVTSSGNITTLSGPQKAGKSAITGWIIAGVLIKVVGELIDPLERLQVSPNPDGCAVLHYDTEQSGEDHEAHQRIILKRLGVTETPENFLSYNVRQLRIEDCRAMLIETASAAHAQFGGIKLIVIDGIADFVYDVNNAAECDEIIKLLSQIAKEYNTAVVVILHTNPGSDKERGHLGSALLRKSESVISVDKDANEVSTLKTKYMRHAGNLQPIAFMYSEEKHYHIGCDSGGAAAMQGKAALKLSGLKEAARQAFPPPTSYKYSEAIEQVMRATGSGERTAKERLKEMTVQGLVTCGADKFYRLNTSA